MLNNLTFKNIGKAITFCISVLILVCSLLLISASADENGGEELQIVGKNVVFGEKTHICFAVNTAVDNAKNVKVMYYLNGNTEDVYYAEYNQRYNYIDDKGTDTEADDVEYPAFITFGFAPNNYTDTVTVIAYSGNPTPNTVGETYSIAEYLYARLYKDNFINSSDKRANLYISMLEFSKNAQSVLDNDKLNNPSYNEQSPETLITDYKYVYTKSQGASVNGAGKSALVKSGEAVTLCAPSENDQGQAFALWELYDAESGALISTVNNNSAFIPEKHIKAVAIYEDLITEGRGSGKYADSELTNNFDTNNEYTCFGAGTDNFMEDIVDSDGALLYYADESYEAGAGFSIKTDNNGKALIIEFDLSIQEIYSSGKELLRFSLGSLDNKRPDLTGLSFAISTNSGGAPIFYSKNTNNSSEAYYSSALEFMKWYNVRIELDGKNSGDTFRIYIDNKLVHTASLSDDVNNANAFIIYSKLNGGFAGYIYFDNIYAGGN